MGKREERWETTITVIVHVIEAILIMIALSVPYFVGKYVARGSSCPCQATSSMEAFQIHSR